MNDTVRLEVMVMDTGAHIVTLPWSQRDVNLPNDPFYYLPMMTKLLWHLRQTYGNGVLVPRVRVVNEQTNRIVDMMQ